MNKDKLIEYYMGVDAINYAPEFVEEQIDSLADIKSNECVTVREESIFLNVILSALKYYIEASPEGYAEDIIRITDRLEAIYNISDLFGALLEVDD